MGRIIGIDLGTTGSCVAVLEGREARLVSNAVGCRTIPSVVALSDRGEKIVGALALRQAITNPEKTITGVKRLVGRRFDSREVGHCREAFAYPIVEGPNGDARVKLGEEEVSPPEILALVLKRLKTTAEEYLGEEVKDAVVSVPSFFDDSQRRAIRDAGRIAGLNVVRLANDTTAAALAYGLGRTKVQKVAILDLGGGHLDVSILELGDGVFQVRATHGDAFLGGMDLDDSVLAHLCEEFRKESGIDVHKDRPALERMREAVERARWELSSASETEVNVPFLAADASGPRHLKVHLTRGKLEELSRSVIERVIDSCRIAMKDAGVGAKDLAEVILVGGATRTARILDMVREVFGREPYRWANPDEVVAIGAAIQAGVLTGEVKDILILDVTPFSLGIETQGGVFTRLLEKNTPIPTRKSRIFSTAVDSQSTVEIHVLQGEAELVAGNFSLGRFELVGLPPAPRGIPQIEVVFEIDADGIVHVSATDQGTGQAQTIRVLSTSGLTEQETQRMLEAAKTTQADTGRKGQDLARARMNLEGLLYTIERHVRTARARLGGETARFDEEVKRARAALDAQNGDEVVKTIDALAGVYQSLLAARQASAALPAPESGPAVGG